MLSLVRPRDPEPLLEPISPWVIWPDAAPRHARPVQSAQQKPDPPMKRPMGRPKTAHILAAHLLEAMPGTVQELADRVGVGRKHAQMIIQRQLYPAKATREQVKDCIYWKYVYSRVGDARV